MARSFAKSYFLHHQKQSWDGLVAEVSSSQIHVSKAQEHANQAEKAFADLAERSRQADEEVKKLREERDQLLVSEVQLRVERDLARGERETPMWQARPLQAETRKAKKLQAEAAAASAGLAVEVGQLRAKV